MKKREKLNSFLTFLCGAFDGSIAAAVTCPFDVVKTHRQIQLGEQHSNTNRLNTSTTFIINDILRTKGYKALFAGIFFKSNWPLLELVLILNSFKQKV